MTLIQIDKVGNPLAEWPMKDDGQFETSGDEVPQDGVFSVRMTATQPTPDELRFRVRVLVNPGLGEEPYQAYSAISVVDVMNRLSVGDCQSTQDVLASAQDAFDDAFLGLGAALAAEAALESLVASGSVAQSGLLSNGSGAWALFQSGLLGVVGGGESGTRSGSGALETSEYSAGNELPIMSREVTVLSPFASEFQDLDESSTVANLLDEKQCPPFDVKLRQNNEASVARFQELSSAGIVSVATHGLVGFKELDPTVKGSSAGNMRGARRCS